MGNSVVDGCLITVIYNYRLCRESCLIINVSVLFSLICFKWVKVTLLDVEEGTLAICVGTCRGWGVQLRPGQTQSIVIHHLTSTHTFCLTQSGPRRTSKEAESSPAGICALIPAFCSNTQPPTHIGDLKIHKSHHIQPAWHGLRSN